MRRMGKSKVCLAVLCIGFWGIGASSAFAQQATTNQVATDYDAQLALDVTPVPAGSGAIFVPSLSIPQRESHVVVYYDGRKVTTGRTGQRIVVPPGTYEVVMGTGEKEDAARTLTRVVDGSTIVLQPFYGGVDLVAVNKQGKAIKADFGIRQNGRRLVKDSTPSDSEDADPPKTYLLSPGPKTWEFSDGTTLAFDIPQGRRVSYRAIFDGDHFVGMEHADDPLKTKEKWWRARWTIGADVSFNYSKNQISDYNGQFFQLGAFTSAEVGVDYKNNLFTLKLDIDESWIAVGSDYGASVPMRSLRDSVKAELLYSYRIFGVFGPFVRATADTSLLGSLYLSKDTVYFQDEDAKIIGALDSDKAYRLMKPFSPTFLEEAVGLNVTAIDMSVFDLVFLGGVAAQQHFFRDGETIDSQKDNRITLKSLDDERFFGALVEARMGLRLGQTFRLSVAGKMFVPYGQIFKKETFAPHYGVYGMAELSIASFASLVYRGEWSKPTNQTKASMFHGASLRLQHNLF